MEQRISLVTLGCHDPQICAAFYAAMGWKQVDAPDGIIVFDLLGQALGLYPLGALAEDMGRPVDQMGTGASTLSYNTKSKEEVAATLARASAAGGTVLRDAFDVFWGGHIGYFQDPEGHVWEVAWNPFSQLGPDGAFRWHGYGGAPTT